MTISPRPVEMLTTQMPIREIDPIRLAWFYKPPQNDSLETLAAHYDFFILTKVDEPERDQLKRLGVQTPILAYVVLNEIQDPGSCNAQPNHNQVTDQIGDFCKISQEHPDWFLLDQMGRRIMNDGYYIMDPGNEEWRSFWLERTRERLEFLNWDGIFLDNVEASLEKWHEMGYFPARYTDQVRLSKRYKRFSFLSVYKLFS